MTRPARILPNASAALLLTLLASTASGHDRLESTCVRGGRQNPDLAAVRAALQRTPTMLGKRMELANLLQRAGCYDDAVRLLEEGERYNPLSPTLQFSLRRARNMVREEHYLDGIDRAEAVHDTAFTGKPQPVQPPRRTAAAEAPARTESTVHKERRTESAAINAAAEAMVEPPAFSNVAEATRSN